MTAAQRALSPHREQVLTILLPVLTAVAFLSVWQVAVKAWAVPTVILPAPSDIAHQLSTVWGELLYQASFTGSEAVVACILSALLGAGTAAILASSPLLRDMLYPTLSCSSLFPRSPWPRSSSSGSA